MNPFSFFLLLLIVIPVVEIYFLIQVGGAIGAFPTVLLIITTAVLGAYLFKQQGMSTFQRVQASLARGEIPATEMIEGAMLLVCGALLLTPGFVTDAVGFACLVPALRHKLAVSILESKIVGNASFQSGQGFQQSNTDAGSDDVLEGEFTREDDSSDKIEK